MGDWTPCPFCGSDELTQGIDDHIPVNSFVECCDCLARGPAKEEWNDAVAAWDGRAGHMGELAKFRSVIIELLDDLRRGKPFDSCAWSRTDHGRGMPVDVDEYNAETRGYREALTDLECAINEAVGVHD